MADKKETKAKEEKAGEGSWLDEEEKFGGSGSGVGVIGSMEVNIGWKFFASGANDEVSFFPYKAGDEKSRDAAKAKAIEKGKELGASKSPTVAVQIKVFKDAVIAIGRKGHTSDGWKGDRTYTFPTWTDDYKEIVKPSLTDKNFKPFPQKFYGRLGFAASATRMKKDQATGEESPELIPLIAEVYASEAAAREAAKELIGDGDSTSGGVVSAGATVKGWSENLVELGWDKTTWATLLPKFRQLSDQGKSPAEIAVQYGIPPANVIGALG